MSLEDYISTRDIEGLVTFCEETELTAPQGIPPPEVYTCLLAVYLLQNELDHAKLLWKRIPGSVKSVNSELGEVWEIGKKLWRKEFAEVYTLIDKTTWSANTAALLAQLTENMRIRVLAMVKKAYSKISLQELGLLLGSNEDRTLAIVQEKGWEVDVASKVVTPRHTQTDATQVEESQKRLARLVDIVSFLEN